MKPLTAEQSQIAELNHDLVFAVICISRSSGSIPEKRN